MMDPDNMTYACWSFVSLFLRKFSSLASDLHFLLLRSSIYHFRHHVFITPTTHLHLQSPKDNINISLPSSIFSGQVKEYHI